jgi:ligand-binding SRPBCC domain-containing protein
VKKVRKLTDGPIGVGTRYHQVRKTDEQDYQITAYDPDHRLVIKTLADSKPRFERWFEFEQEENGTKIVDTWTLDLGGNPLIEMIGTRKVKFAVAENLWKLKDLLEKGETQLQDGRVIEI